MIKLIYINILVIQAIGNIIITDNKKLTSKLLLCYNFGNDKFILFKDISITVFGLYSFSYVNKFMNNFDSPILPSDSIIYNLNGINLMNNDQIYLVSSILNNNNDLDNNDKSYCSGYKNDKTYIYSKLSFNNNYNNNVTVISNNMDNYFLCYCYNNDDVDNTCYVYDLNSYYIHNINNSYVQNNGIYTFSLNN